jgi:hypothetical protein
MRWLVGFLFAALLVTPCWAGWQSRDSNYNTVFVSGGGGAYAGPGDVVSGATIWYGFRAYSLAKAGTRVANICNAGAASCADVNSLANGDFDVATAQGAPLNCGGAGGTCTVAKLYDQTVGNNCTGVTCDLSASGSAQPTVVFNAVGTKTCMGFNGTSNQISDLLNSLSPVVNQPFTASWVAKAVSPTAQVSVLQFGTSNSQMGYHNSVANQVWLYGGSVLAATASDGSFHALQAVFNGGSSDMNVDGSQNTGAGGSTGMQGQILVGQFSGGQFLPGSLCEVGGWPSGFSSGQSSNMSSNQHSYWGF